MRKFISIVIIIFISSLVYAQERYLDEITDSVASITYTYIKKEGQRLDMDIYTPAFDDKKDRPVFLYLHGGGFYTGIRNDDGAITFCKKIAKRGYVSVTIDYRLLRKGTETHFGCDCPVKDKLLAIRAAVEDLQDAVRFLVKKKNDIGIDPNTIIVCGSSAGAETVLSAVYNPLTYEDGFTPKKYAGVISLAGAVVDTSRITNDMVIPSMFFHGTSDDIVPYGTASHHYCAENSDGYLVLNGSKSITEKLKKLDASFWLCSIKGKDHCVSWTPMKEQFNDIITFCNDFILQHNRKQISTLILCENNGL